MVALSACNSKKSGIDLSNLDTSANPKNDFYQYATGGWQQKNPLPNEFARYGSFDKLAQDNVQQVNDLIVELAAGNSPAGSVAAKIATFYNVGMDTAKTNAQGAEPIRAMLEKIATLPDRKAIDAEIAELHKKGIFPFFGVFSEADFSDSSMEIAWLYQTGLGMADRDYYLEKDAHTTSIRAAYEQMMAKLFRLADYHSAVGETPEALAKKVLALETQLAEAWMNRHDERDPYKMFNKTSTEELYKKLSPEFDFQAYFAALGLPELGSLNVAQPAYIAAVNKLLKTEKPETLRAYLAWNLIRNAAPYLSDAFINENFNFYGRILSGTEEIQPRWKRVVNNVNGALGEAVGQIYVEKYFPASSKENMIRLVNNVKDALGQRIQAAEWMSDETKALALEKLSTFIVKIGYPDKWRDYAALEVNTDSYYANIIRSNEFDNAFTWNKINKPKDVMEWGMTPQTVNAYYNPTTNEICFPAGILQPPFYFADADNAVNYGAIGVVIAHEMTHGFDDQGRQYDKTGNLQDWWLPQDAENFTQRTQVLVDHFDNINVLPDLKADGKYTLGENIADNGGVQISFQAMHNAAQKGEIGGLMDGFTPEQRFFIAYAGVWAGNIREAEIRRRTKEDVHSLGEWRVNGTLPHIEGFIKAFDIQPGDNMYLAPEKQAAIW
jgi:putative endopeptidase